MTEKDAPRLTWHPQVYCCALALLVVLVTAGLSWLSALASGVPWSPDPAAWLFAYAFWHLTIWAAMGFRVEKALVPVGGFLLSSGATLVVCEETGVLPAGAVSRAFADILSFTVRAGAPDGLLPNLMSAVVGWPAGWLVACGCLCWLVGTILPIGLSGPRQRFEQYATAAATQQLRRKVARQNGWE